MSDVLLSIGIPTYNRLGYLKECIESCKKIKTLGYKIEIIVSSNSTSDGTKEYIEDVQSLNTNVIIKKNHFIKPVPPIVNWDYTLNNATGKYFILLSDDDRIDADALIHISGYDKGQKNINGILFSNNIVNNTGKIIKKKINEENVMDAETFFAKLVNRKIKYNFCSFVANCEVLKKSMIYQEKFLGSGMFADGASILVCCQSEKNIVVSSKVMMDYRVHEHMDSKNIDSKLMTAAKMHFIDFIQKNKYINNRLRDVAEYWVYNGTIYQCIMFYMCCRDKKNEIIKILDFVKKSIYINKKTGIRYIAVRFKIESILMLLKIM